MHVSRRLDTCCALRDRSSACFMAFFVHVCQYRIRLCPSSPHDHLPSACTVLSLVISVAVRYCGACRGRTREANQRANPKTQALKISPATRQKGKRSLSPDASLAAERAGGGRAPPASNNSLLLARSRPFCAFSFSRNTLASSAASARRRSRSSCNRRAHPGHLRVKLRDRAATPAIRIPTRA